MSILKIERYDIKETLTDHTHNRAIVVKALTQDLKVKTLTVLYHSEESWNDHSQWGSTEFIQAALFQTIHKDQTVLGFKAFYCQVQPDKGLTSSAETVPAFLNHDFKTT